MQDQLIYTVIGFGIKRIPGLGICCICIGDQCWSCQWAHGNCYSACITSSHQEAETVGSLRGRTKLLLNTFQAWAQWGGLHSKVICMVGSICDATACGEIKVWQDNRSKILAIFICCGTPIISMQWIISVGYIHLIIHTGYKLTEKWKQP
jgi:hypothetical protein